MSSISRPDKVTLSDEALTEMLKLDHAWALKEIFQRYNLRLFRLAAAVLRDDDLAKDMVQNVFIDLWNRRHTSGIQRLSAYLTKAIKFQVLKQIRDGKWLEHHAQLAPGIQIANQTEELVDYNDLEKFLEKAVDELSPRCREVLVLSRYQNLSHKEISARLNISTKTVEAQIRKGLSLLRQKMGRILFIGCLCLFF